MSADPDKRQRHLDLLRKSRKVLEETELAERESATEPSRGRRKDDPPAAPPADDAGEVVMYRGRPVRRPSGRGGGRSTGAQFRNTSAKGAGRSRRPSGGGDVREALERLNELYADGLISRADFDKKRQQILDRL